MGMLILFSILYGVIWGALWGAIDGVCLLKGVLADMTSPMQQIGRSLLAMFASLFLVSLLLGGNNIFALIVAIFISYPVRDWVLRNWQGL